MATQHNPLPDSLTRLLDTSAVRSFAPTPGDHGRGEPHSASDRTDRLDALLVRVLAIAVSGLVWLGILWLILRHLAA